MQTKAITPDQATPAQQTPDQRRIVSADGSEVLTFLETAAETGGARTYVEAELAPGSGTPPHSHQTYSEDFEVLEGTLHVEVDGRSLEVGPGERAFVPAHAAHLFANKGDGPVRFRCALEPASRGFEELQQIGAGLQADGLCRGEMPRKPSHLGLGLILADTTLTGRLGLAMPLLLFLGRRARRRGVDAELRRRYVSW